MQKKAFPRLLLVLLAVVCSAAFLLVPAQAEETDFPTVLAQAKQGVVHIYALGYNAADVPESAWTGSGFAVGPAGEDSDIFLTNWHVATGDGAYDQNHVRIWILTEDCQVDDQTHCPDPATSVECQIIKTSTGYPDYAIIQAKSPIQGFKPLPLLPSEEIPDGDTVYALGFPGIVDDISITSHTTDDITVTNGIVSKHMQFTLADNNWVLMHTAQISGGNSGGPLINSKGAVVGLNTYGYGKDNDGRFFAIYIDYAIDALEDVGIVFDLYSDTPAEIKEESSTAADWIGEHIVIILAAAAAAAVVITAIVVTVNRQKKSVPAVAETPKDPPRENFVQTAPIQKPQFRIMLPDGRCLPVPMGISTIGRDPNCEIRLPEQYSMVSRRHCQLECRSNMLILMDAGSQNGTFIHGKRVPANAKVMLKNGSSFSVGNLETIITVC